MTFVPTHEVSPLIQERQGKGPDSDCAQAYAVAFDTTQLTSKTNRSAPKPGDPSHTLSGKAHPPAVAISFDKGRGEHTGDEVSGTLRCNQGKSEGVNNGKADNACVAFQPGNLTSGRGSPPTEELSPPLKAESDGDLRQCVVTPPLTGKPPYGDNLSRESLLVQQPFFIHSQNSEAMKRDGAAKAGEPAEVARSLDTNGGFAQGQGGNIVVGFKAAAHPMPMSSRIETGETVSTLTAQTSEGRGGTDAPKILSGMCVRRLTPVECERLQGFEDDWTLWKETKGIRRQKDSPRYRQIGNAVSQPVARWFGRRIVKILKVVDSIHKPE